MSDELKKCPSCAEDIKIDAIKCRYCGEKLKSKKDNKSKYKNLFSYFFGIIFIIGGIGLLGEATIYAISLLIIGIGLLPQVKEKIYKKFNISGKIYGISLFIIFALGAISMPNNVDTTNNINEIQKDEVKTIDNKIVETKDIEKETETEILTEEEKIKKEKEIEENKIKKEKEKQDVLIQKDIDDINIFIGLIDNYKRGDSYNTVKSIEMSAYIFGSFAVTYNKYKNNTNLKIKNKAEELRKKASALQIKEFPQMREKYIELFKQKMWEHNIEVYGKGGLNGTIEITGGIYANNKNKLDTYSAIKSMLKLLRFDRVNFKWYKYDNDYTYWELESLPDSKVDVQNN